METQGTPSPGSQRTSLYLHCRHVWRHKRGCIAVGSCSGFLQHRPGQSAFGGGQAEDSTSHLCCQLQFTQFSTDHWLLRSYWYVFYLKWNDHVLNIFVLPQPLTPLASLIRRVISSKIWWHVPCRKCALTQMASTWHVSFCRKTKAHPRTCLRSCSD